jgi:hypothetical protein
MFKRKKVDVGLIFASKILELCDDYTFWVGIYGGSVHGEPYYPAWRENRGQQMNFDNFDKYIKIYSAHGFEKYLKKSFPNKFEGWEIGANLSNVKNNPYYIIDKKTCGNPLTYPIQNSQDLLEHLNHTLHYFGCNDLEYSILGGLLIGRTGRIHF